MGWLRWLTGRRGVYVWLALASLALLAVYASMWAFGSGVNPIGTTVSQLTISAVAPV